MNTNQECKPKEESKNKKSPEPLTDLDDFIFKDEEIKYQSER
ncbi:MAG: hypothetical protein UH854_05090 [Clostridia bacterium]|nr:hypothetical protein [Clostridia bacterium]